MLKDGDLDELLSAIDDIARAKGMTQISKDTGLRKAPRTKQTTHIAKDFCF